MSFWIYILRCADGSYYTGHTDNLEKRIAEHQSGEIKGYTSTRLMIGDVFEQVRYISPFALSPKPFVLSLKPFALSPSKGEHWRIEKRANVPLTVLSAQKAVGLRLETGDSKNGAPNS